MSLDLVPYGIGRLLVGKLQFDSPEARSGGRAKPFEQRTIGKQLSEVGSKTGHRPLFWWGDDG